MPSGTVTDCDFLHPNTASVFHAATTTHPKTSNHDPVHDIGTSLNEIIDLLEGRARSNRRTAAGLAGARERGSAPLQAEARPSQEAL